MSGAPREIRGPDYGNILDTVEAKPIVRLSCLMATANVEGKILAKFVFLNIRDRSRIAMAWK